jgi:hypothetical protein
VVNAIDDGLAIGYQRGEHQRRRRTQIASLNRRSAQRRSSMNYGSDSRKCFP